MHESPTVTHGPRQGACTIDLVVRTRYPVDPDYLYPACERVFGREGSLYRCPLEGGSHWACSDIPELTVMPSAEGAPGIRAELRLNYIPHLLVAVFPLLAYGFSLGFLESFHADILHGEGMEWFATVVDVQNVVFRTLLTVFDASWRVMKATGLTIALVALPFLVPPVMIVHDRFRRERKMKRDLARLSAATNAYQARARNEAPERLDELRFTMLPARAASRSGFSHHVKAQWAPNLDETSAVEEAFGGEVNKLLRREGTVKRMGRSLRWSHDKSPVSVTATPLGEATDVELHGSLAGMWWVYAFWSIFILYFAVYTWMDWVLLADVKPKEFSVWTPPVGYMELQTRFPAFAATILGSILALVLVRHMRARMVRRCERVGSALKAMLETVGCPRALQHDRSAPAIPDDRTR